MTQMRAMIPYTDSKSPKFHSDETRLKVLSTESTMPWILALGTFFKTSSLSGSDSSTLVMVDDELSGASFVVDDDASFVEFSPFLDSVVMYLSPICLVLDNGGGKEG